ncbi:MAG: Teichoic acid export ATP-binding protein TagH [uncultured Acidimicrobiales bacterium]|uniref:Teichoic acid export ATP-binding protein TagH n=1 Tax=uncultured Acidimicrobiales bacterium TaxID=310071 RepID=A0A6J4HF74_9ACTN|nr:MAG: Teichoic acid export ATP-binding protein TagH [uncultured Acidimicrobiales bacterium]
MTSAVTFREVTKTFRIWNERNDSLKAKVLHRGHGRYTDFIALREASFEIEEGRTFGLVGSNGAGKSTSLKLMANILVPDAGEVDVKGKVSALLELGAGFHPDLTGRENIYLNSSILGLSRKVVRSRFDEIVDFSGLSTFIDNQVKTYSSGMFARLGFAVAVHVEPDVLLLDEALSVGDAEFQRRCAEKIAELRAGGRTVVIVSHDLHLVRQMCSELAWIDHGDLKEVGPTDDVIEQYQRAAHPDAVVDEEGRLRFGSGAARVRTAELVVPAGERPVARNKLTVRLSLDRAPGDRRYVVGIDIRRSDGIMVSQISTRSQPGLSGRICGGGALTYDIGELPLLAGSYVLHTWLVDEETQELLDATDQLDFEVDPQPHADDNGLVALGGGWDVEP